MLISSYYVLKHAAGLESCKVPLGCQTMYFHHSGSFVTLRRKGCCLGKRHRDSKQWPTGSTHTLTSNSALDYASNTLQSYVTLMFLSEDHLSDLKKLARLFQDSTPWASRLVCHCIVYRHSRMALSSFAPHQATLRVNFCAHEADRLDDRRHLT